MDVSSFLHPPCFSVSSLLHPSYAPLHPFSLFLCCFRVTLNNVSFVLYAIHLTIEHFFQRKINGDDNVFWSVSLGVILGAKAILEHGSFKV